MPGNAGSRVRGALAAPERLVMALRAGRQERAPDMEPVLVVLDGPSITLILDDGERLVFDAAELRSAVTGPEHRLTTRRAAA